MTEGEIQGRCKILAQTLGEWKKDEYVYEDDKITVRYRPEAGDMKVCTRGFVVLTIVGGRVVNDQTRLEEMRPTLPYLRNLTDSF